MRTLKLRILILFVIIFGVPHIGMAESTSIDDSLPEHFLLQFLGKKKYIWIIFNENLGIPKIRGDLYYERFGRVRQQHYVFCGVGSINYGETEITVSDTDIIINGAAMGSYNNVLIENDGTVRMGAFLRTFH